MQPDYKWYYNHKKQDKQKYFLKKVFFFLARYIFLPYLCNVKRKRPHSLTNTNIRRGGRVVDCTGLENRRTERYRGFESLSLRKKQENFLVLLFCFIVSRELPHGLDREQNKKNATAFLFLAKEPQKGIDERNKVKRSQFLTQKEFQSLGGYAKSLVNL